MSDSPCAGLRVVDLSSGPVGGVATMVLADFGADVIKVEPPGGDPFRHLVAAPVWLRGKRSVALDLKTAAGVARLHALVADADVVLTTYRPTTAERLGADYPTFAALKPGLIYCSITGFGPTGPYARYKGYEGIVAAKAGRMREFEGQANRPGPVFTSVPVGGHAASQAAVQGIIAALLARERTGRGQLVETSLLQGFAAYDWTGLLLRQLRPRFPDQFPDNLPPPTARQPTLQYQPVLTEDGRWIQMGGLVEHHFHAFIAAAGLDSLYEDPRFDAFPALDEQFREEVRALILARMRERTLDEWMARLTADPNVAAEPIVAAQQGIDHPQLAHNGNVIRLADPHHGEITQIGPLAILPLTPGRVTASAPAAGEHPSATFHPRHEATQPTRSRDAAPTDAPPAPLAGVTIVEFATMLATPLAVALLADMGARVIKVESTTGDIMRRNTNGIVAAKTTTGKESIAVDLKTEAGRRIARRLIAKADAIVHNFRPGVMERFGLGYNDVAREHPAIVYVSCSGYGIDGPSAHRPMAHPLAGAATGGVHRQLGAALPDRFDTPDQLRDAARRVMRANEPNPDPTSSMLFATAILLGLWTQHTRGIGQHIRTNMLLANAYANLDLFLRYEGMPSPPQVDPDLLGLGPLYRLYPTPDGWLFLACPFEEEWRRLCRVLERPDLATDPRFAGADARLANDDALAATLTTIFAERTADAWENLLTRHDLAGVRVSDEPVGGVLLNDEQVRCNGFVREVEHSAWGRHLRHGPMTTFSESPGRYAAGVLAGEQTVPLLQELGYEDDEIHQLIETSVVVTPTREQGTGSREQASR